jgi:hypothetical protein
MTQLAAPSDTSWHIYLPPKLIELSVSSLELSVDCGNSIIPFIYLDGDIRKNIA